MGALYSELDERLITFISRQPMFFVATAPCLDAAGSGGHVNVSPKGYRDTFAVLDPLTVAYLDLTGSGAETIAHLRQNGKITIMFCSFDRAPKILRIHGTGRVILPDEPDWAELAVHFPGANEPAERVGSHSSHVLDSVDLDDIEQVAGLAESGGRTDDGDPDDDGADDDGTAAGLARDRGNHRAIIVVSADRISDSCGYAVPLMQIVGERDLLARWADRKTRDDLVAYRIKHNSESIDGLPALS